MPEAKERTCPVCGLPVPGGAKHCENCGAKIAKSRTRKGKPAAESEDTTTRETAAEIPKPKPEEVPPKPEEPTPEATGSAVLYLCPACGAFVKGSAATCNRCGASLSVEAEEAHEESVESRLCPHCGSTVHVTAGTCPACGKSIAPPPVKAVPSRQDVTCMECGALIPASEDTCAICGTSRRGERLEPTREAPKEPAVDDFLDLERDLALEPPEPAPAPVPKPEEIPPKPAEEEPRRVKPAPLPPPPLPKEEIEPERERELQKHLEDLLTLVEPETPPVMPAKVPEAPAAVHPGSGPRPATRPAARPTPRALPEAPTAPRPRPASTPARIAAIRDIAAISTAIALPVVALAALAMRPPAYEFGYNLGRLLLFGILFGLGLSVTAPDLRPVVRKRGRMAIFALGAVVLAVVPLLPMMDVGPGFTLLLAILGTILVLVGAWPFRRTIGAFLPWLSGLLMLTILSVIALAKELGTSEVETSLWLLGGILAIGPSALVPYRHGLRHFAETALARADTEYQAQRFEQAIAAYDDAIDYGRRSGRELEAAWYGRGSALVAVGRHQEALLALDRALGLNPNNEVAWVNKGTVLARMNQLSDALRCYNSAIKVNPNYEVAWNNKGNALARIGRHERALQCYERALQIDPGYRTAWVNKGFVLAKLGRFEEAALCAEQARSLTSELTVPG